MCLDSGSDALRRLYKKRTTSPTVLAFPTPVLLPTSDAEHDTCLLMGLRRLLHPIQAMHSNWTQPQNH